MLFKSGRFWSLIGSSALALAGASSAFALTVTLANFGYPQNSAAPNSTFYFPAKSTGYQNSKGDNLPAVNPLSTVIGSTTMVDLAHNNSSNSDWILFNVTPGPLPSPSGGTTNANFLVVTVDGQSSGLTLAVPIVSLNGNPCWQDGVNANGFCQVENTAANTKWYHAVLLNGGTVQIGLNMRALCDEYYLNNNNGAQQPSGCSSQFFWFVGPPAPTYTTYAPFTLKFSTYSLPNPAPNYSNGFLTGLTASDTATVQLIFSAQGIASGAFQCSLNGVYSPRDKAITVDGSRFSVSTTSSANGAANGLAQIIVFGSNQGTAHGAYTDAASLAYYQSHPHDIYQSISNAPGQGVGGFINSTPNLATNYEVGFIGVDDYGYAVDNTNATSAGTTTSCMLPYGVQTADIQGFLNSGKCFIATATFRSMDAGPVLMLRHFRDQVLEQFTLGRAFVHLYYEFSPPAAQWLVAHPMFRFPIFLALVPVQVLAWLLLRPLFFLTLLCLGTGLMVYAILSRSPLKQEQMK